MIALTGRSLIAGERAEPSSECFFGVDPAAGRPLPTRFHTASEADVDRAARAALAAQSSLRDAELRACFLTSVAERLADRATAIVEQAQLETALPPARLTGELARTTAQLRLFADVAQEGSWVDARIDPGDPHRSPLPKPDVRSLRVALGPVAVFGASNFPLAFSVAGGDTASAWAAGCPVVVKAHPAHPGTSELVGDAISIAADEVGLPGGVFSLLFDDGLEIGRALVQHPLIRAVGFTGSRGGGLALSRLAAERPVPIPVFAEMASINPVVFLPSALAESSERLAQGLFESATLGGGQFCTQPGLALVPVGDDGDDFVEQLASRFEASRQTSMLTEGIAQAYDQGCQRFDQAGARLRAEGEMTGEHATVTARLWEIELAELKPQSPLLGEVFGPTTLVARYADLRELDNLPNLLEGQLTAALFSGDPAPDPESEAAHRLWQALAQCAGRLIFGQFPTGVEVNHAMVHGGPFPATTDPRTTSVGARAVERFARLVAFQNAPPALLPTELQDDNPRQIWRQLDGEVTRDPVR
ncbi:MAG: aldehyde dehydrogenase (NADP(+)) [Acidobacteriota bacterium]